jgi:hypothetical protein
MFLKVFRVFVFAAVLSGTSIADAAEVVIDFEDASTTQSHTPISSTYKGLSWNSDTYVIYKNAITGTGYQYGTQGNYSVFNAYSRKISISFPSSVSIDGAYLTNAWHATNIITIKGYLSGSEVYSTSVSPGTTSATWYNLSFKGIDKLVLTPSNSSGGHFVLDDLTYFTDTDGDGYYDDDCDDTNASVNPGATEMCDGVDNDCDGTVDEDSAADAKTWYADADSDSYGDATVSDIDCYQPTGYVSDNTDCDDTNATTYPGATEY